MDVLEGTRKAPFLFGPHEEGQVTFAEAVGDSQESNAELLQ